MELWLDAGGIATRPGAVLWRGMSPTGENLESRARWVARISMGGLPVTLTHANFVGRPTRLRIATNSYVGIV